MAKQFKTLAGDLLHVFWPRWLAYFSLRIRAGMGRESFSTEVMRRLAFDRREILVTFVDKVAARDYCREKCPRIELPRLYQVVERAEDLNPSLWPDEFVIKPSHGCGAVVLVSRDQRPGLSYNIDTKKFRWDQGAWGMASSNVNTKKLVELASHWLRSDYEYWTFKVPEWAYRHAPKSVLVEELVVGPQGQAPIEARFHCFHGRVGLARITDVLGADETSWTFDRSGRMLDAWLSSDKSRVPRPFTLPPIWHDAVRFAEDVSKGIDYLRVDLFVMEERVVLSELTPYPNSGTVDFVPAQLSRWLASRWRTPEVSPYLKVPPARVVDFS